MAFDVIVERSREWFDVREYRRHSELPLSGDSSPPVGVDSDVALSRGAGSGSPDAAGVASARSASGAFSGFGAASPASVSGSSGAARRRRRRRLVSFPSCVAAPASDEPRPASLPGVGARSFDLHVLQVALGAHGGGHGEGLMGKRHGYAADQVGVGHALQTGERRGERRPAAGRIGGALMLVELELSVDVDVGARMLVEVDHQLKAILTVPLH